VNMFILKSEHVYTGRVNMFYTGGVNMFILKSEHVYTEE
jgi:hypothetical protein